MYIPALLLLLPIGLAAAQDDIIYVTITAPPAPASTSYTDDSAFQNDMLAASNFYRREHGVADVAWDAQLAAVAADWAARCEFRHSDGPTGENLATGYPSVDSSVDAWGLERLAYDYDRPGFSEETGHFTQLVWSNTTRIGCGRRDCEGFDGTAGWLVVCEYSPQGNIIGDNNQYFVENVPRQVYGLPTDTIESGVIPVPDIVRDGMQDLSHAIHSLTGGFKLAVSPDDAAAPSDNEVIPGDNSHDPSPEASDDSATEEPEVEAEDEETDTETYDGATESEEDIPDDSADAEADENGEDDARAGSESDAAEDDDEGTDGEVDPSADADDELLSTEGSVDGSPSDSPDGDSPTDDSDPPSSFPYNPDNGPILKTAGNGAEFCVPRIRSMAWLVLGSVLVLVAI